ncbi:MAG: T9SS type A sorting domain-containing protein [Saprospiraceae bacterium]
MAVVEGCGENSTGGFSTGFVNQFSVENNNPFSAMDCSENIGAFDPNDKQAFPRGYGDQNYLHANTDIEYLIRFQNTGTDTAFNIVVLDTLSNFLDIGSFRLGASSHPVDFEILGNGLAIFKFNNIMLPDSNVNLAGSQGFVQFKISQKNDLPIGTILENDAAIYFDFNEPIITNTAFHTIGENFISVNTQKLFLPNLTVRTFPNPFEDLVQFEIDGTQFDQIQLNVYDLTGRLIRTSSHTENQFSFYRNQLLSGMYFYTLEGNGAMISSGKITVK